MPLFIFISGYFTNTTKGKIQFFDSVLNIFCTFIVFQIIRIVYLMITTNSISLHTIICPQWTLWYLLSVVYWRTLFYIISKKHSGIINFQIILLCFVVSIVCGYIPIGNAFSIQRTLYYGTFFALGLYFRNKQLISKIYNTSNKTIILFFILSLLGIIIFQDKNINWLLYGNSAYSGWPINITLCPIVRTAQFILSCMICFLVILFCPKISFLSTLGKSTLFIYIYHSFIITFLNHFDNIGGGDFSTLLITLTTVIFSLLLMNKISFFHHLIEPYKYIKGIKKRG